MCSVRPRASVNPHNSPKDWHTCIHTAQESTCWRVFDVWCVIVFWSDSHASNSPHSLSTIEHVIDHHPWNVISDPLGSCKVQGVISIIIVLCYRFCQSKEMESRQSRALTDAFVDLVKDLNPDPVLDILLSKRILSAEDYERIRAIRLRRERVRDLIPLLRHKGPDAFGIFCEALEQCQPFLGELLQTKLRQGVAGRPRCRLLILLFVY